MSPTKNSNNRRIRPSPAQQGPQTATSPDFATSLDISKAGLEFDTHMLHGAGIFTYTCPKNHPVL